MPCRVTVNGVTRSDVGMPSSQEPIKGAYSDALKRAAVHFGIGRELYELPRIYVKLDDYKKPVAIPTYRNGRWTLPSGAGSVFYDREPEDQPEPRGAKASSPRAAPVSHPAQLSGGQQALIGELTEVPGMTVARMSLLADAVGVAKGTRANADQLREMLARTVEQPESPRAHADPGVAGAAEAGAAVSDNPPSDKASPAKADGPLAATVQPESESVPPGSSASAAPEPTMDDVLAITGGQEVAPDYASDPEGYKAWYEALGPSERATLRGQGRSPRQMADAAKQRPDAEQIRASLGGES
ncbi:MAG: hypothetical protein LC798_21195 [Chloroflexi bacterium]|nr:hypothetical protein [Chloroflexota bacterium]